LGVVNCGTLTIPLTLDNSRSADMTRFDVNLWGEPTFAQSFPVAAGSSKLVTIPLADHQSYGLVVSDPEAAYGSQALFEDDIFVSCQPNERGALASIGEVACSDVSVDIILDNTRAAEATTFRVDIILAGESEESEPEFVPVPAGGSRTITRALWDQANAYIRVTDLADNDLSLVEESIDVACTPGPRHDPRASVGQFCIGRSVPVLLDNSRSTHPVHFSVFVEDGNNGSNEFFSKEFVVSAGAERRILARVPRSINAVSGFVLDGDYLNYVFNPPFVADNDYLTQFSRTRSFCGPRHIAASPTVAVKGAKLAATGGFNFFLPLLGTALLAGGAGMVVLSRRRPRTRSERHEALAVYRPSEAPGT
jgi:hypothetical protein